MLRWHLLQVRRLIFFLVAHASSRLYLAQLRIQMHGVFALLERTRCSKIDTVIHLWCIHVGFRLVHCNFNYF